jgi:hypothetical protein
VELPPMHDQALARFILAIIVSAIPAFPVNAQADSVPVDVNTRDIIRQVVPRDAIPALVTPKYDAIKDATYMRSDDLVIALDFGGEDLAYPTRILEHHEIVNDLVNGQPILVTY